MERLIINFSRLAWSDPGKQTVIYLNGGSTDVAYENAKTDIQDLDAMDTVPVYWANLGIGHMGDILEDNGGQFGWALASWLRYQFFGDAQSKALFVGENCGLCQDNDHDSLLWSLDKYNGAP